MSAEHMSAEHMSAEQMSYRGEQMSSGSLSAEQVSGEQMSVGEQMSSEQMSYLKFRLSKCRLSICHGTTTVLQYCSKRCTLMVENVAGTKIREFFLATFATLSTVFCNFRFSRNIKYPRLLVPKSRDSNRDFRDIKYPRHFLPLK